MLKFHIFAVCMGLGLVGCAGQPVVGESGPKREIAQSLDIKIEEGFKLAHLVTCDSRIEDEKSFTEFDVTPGAEGKFRDLRNRTENIRLKNGRVVNVEYRLIWLREKTAMIQVNFKIAGEAVLTISGDYSRYEQIDPVTAYNPKEQLSVSCRTSRTTIPKKQPEIDGGNTQGKP